MLTKKLIADKKKAALNEKDLEEKYNQLKAEGDKELSNQNFNLAKQKYKEVRMTQELYSRNELTWS